MPPVILTTKIHLHPQLIQDALISREAIDLVRDWMGDYFEATISLRNWTPYWKEIQIHRPEKTIHFRFRLGGPVAVIHSENWEITQTELASLESALLEYLDKLGKAITQKRVADAIQNKYPRSSRKARDDDSIVLQFLARPATSSLDPIPLQPVDVAVIVQPGRALKVFARCQHEDLGHGTIRRLLANLQIAGIPVAKTDEIVARL